MLSGQVLVRREAGGLGDKVAQVVKAEFNYLNKFLVSPVSLIYLYHHFSPFSLTSFHIIIILVLKNKTENYI